MSLPRFDVQGSLFGEPRMRLPPICLTTKINPALRDEGLRRSPASRREELAKCYEPENGRPGIEPVVLLGVLMLPVSRACTGSASSRASEISSGLEIGSQPEAWGREIPPEHPGAFPTTLIGKGKERAGSAGGVGGFRKGRFCGQALKQRLDSTHILAAVARLSALECVRETLALALEELEKNLPEDRRPPFWEQHWERYVESKLDYKIAQRACNLNSAKPARIVCSCWIGSNRWGVNFATLKGWRCCARFVANNTSSIRAGRLRRAPSNRSKCMEAGECKVPMIRRRSGVLKARANRKRTGWVTKCRWPRR